MLRLVPFIVFISDPCPRSCELLTMWVDVIEYSIRTLKPVKPKRDLAEQRKKEEKKTFDWLLC